MFTITWIQNGIVCSARTHSPSEAMDMANAARARYSYLSLEYTDATA